MKKNILAILMLFSGVLRAQTYTNIAAGTQVVGSGGVQVSVQGGSFTNNGNYFDTSGTFNVLGGTTFSGTGSTVFGNLIVNNPGSSVFNALVSVYKTATLTPGSSANASGNLYVRSDVSAAANLVNNGALTNEVQGLTTMATAASGGCNFTSTLSINVSGAAMQYQWQLSPDSIAWSNIAGGTAAAYTAIVTATGWYRCFLTTNNSSFMEATQPVLLTMAGIGPAAITGPAVLCSGATALLSDATSAGAWSSSNSAVATAGSTGAVGGIAAGTSIISYTLPTGCLTTYAITVNATPAAITDAAAVCNGAAAPFSDTTLSGAWTSGNTAIATVDALSGMANGVSAGAVTISYTVNGCFVTAPLTVNPLPAAITGAAAACAGSATVLSDTTTGGSWSSDAAAIASVGTSGSVAGIMAGSAAISYTLSTGCFVTKAVTINPLPAIHTVTGGGSYCAGAGGVHAGLNGSDDGISYQLLLHDTLAAGSPIAGTGAALDFGLDTAAGAYTVMATDTTTLCTSVMAGSTVITINPLPALHTLTGGGSYCSGGTGVHVGLSGSDTGVRYQLYHGPALTGSLVAGTGPALDFGIETGAGVYTVIATDTATGCARNMADSSVVVINPLPPVHNVTGGGSYCAGTGGVHVGLDGSDTGIDYQLYYTGSTTIGGPVAGTGSLFNFGLDTAAGTYTVIATNDATGCAGNMAGSAAVVITPVVIPSVNISSSIRDTICAGETITFTASPTHGGDGPGYQWMVNGIVEGPHGSTYSYVPANGDIVSVKLTSDTVCAIPDTATDTMTVVVHPRELPTVMLAVAPGDSICEGTSVVITATPGYGGSAPAYTWIKNTVVVSTDSFYAYTPANRDNVYCIMQSDYFCRSATAAYSNVIDMTVDSPVVPTVFISADAGTLISTGAADTFTAIVTNGGVDPSYQWYVNGAPHSGATSALFVLSTLTNKDSISCIVTRNDICHLSNFSSVIVSVSDLGVQQTSSPGNNITLAPNPNNGVFTVTGTLGLSQIVGEDVDMEITDIPGQVVYRNKTTSLNGAIHAAVNASTLADGVYILTLHSENGSTAIRFVVAR